MSLIKIITKMTGKNYESRENFLGSYIDGDEYEICFYKEANEVVFLEECYTSQMSLGYYTRYSCLGRVSLHFFSKWTEEMEKEKDCFDFYEKFDELLEEIETIQESPEYQITKSELLVSDLCDYYTHKGIVEKNKNKDNSSERLIEIIKESQLIVEELEEKLGF